MPTSAGMHRISWNMRYQPLAQERTEVDATGAIPNRSSPAPSSPWAPPGQYTVRLTVAGKSYTQPLTVRLDPRVKTPAAALAQNAKLAVEMYELARSMRMSYGQAQDLSAELAKVGSDVSVNPLKAQIDSLAPAPVRGFRGFFRGGPRPPPNLESASTAALAASLALQSAEIAPTEAQIAACARARDEARAVMARWSTLKTTGLSSLNATLKSKGRSAIMLPAPRMEKALPADANGNENENEG
jgi:hypothetical protein